MAGIHAVLRKFQWIGTLPEDGSRTEETNAAHSQYFLKVSKLYIITYRYPNISVRRQGMIDCINKSWNVGI